MAVWFEEVSTKLISLVLSSVFMCSCAPGTHKKNDIPPVPPAKDAVIVQNNAYDGVLSGNKENVVETLISQMSLSEKIYQMMFVTPESLTGVGTVTAGGAKTKESLTKRPVGGVIYFSKNFENRNQTIDMIKKTQEYSPIPLFIGVDEEGGVVSRLGSKSAMGTTKQPPMANIGATGDPAKAYNVGKSLATDLKPFGFNVDFAPDADVLTNPKNTEIGNRSFGSNPELVAKMVEQVVLGLEDNGVSSVLKHFPGHGSTSRNSHTGYSESTRTLEQLQQSEFLPFKAGINAGADFVMMSHMTLVNVVNDKLPSSLSKTIITDLLKNQLGFKGIVITDSCEMGAIVEEYTVEQASVMAIEAGVDMILMPKDLQRAHDAIYKAVVDGRISPERIDESVRKILTKKQERGLF